jgi:hypothetical protein
MGLLPLQRAATAHTRLLGAACLALPALPGTAAVAQAAGTSWHPLPLLDAHAAVSLPLATPPVLWAVRSVPLPLPLLLLLSKLFLLLLLLCLLLLLPLLLLLLLQRR